MAAKMAELHSEIEAVLFEAAGESQVVDGDRARRRQDAVRLVDAAVERKLETRSPGLTERFSSYLCVVLVATGFAAFSASAVGIYAELH